MDKSEQLDAIIATLVRATDPDEIQAAYADWANTYEQDLDFYGYLAPQIGAQHLADALPDQAAKILDAGCGTGLVGVALAERGYERIDGVDFSAEMRQKAKSTGLYAELFSADFYKPLTQFSDNSYDAITLIGVYYTALKQYLIPELLRIVKPGGIVVISCRLQYYANDLQLQAQRFEADGVATTLKESQQTYMAGQDADAVYLVLQKRVTVAWLKQQLKQSQAAFLQLLSETGDDALYQSEGDAWTIAQTLVHMCEARNFYADAIDQLRQNPGMMIGRDLTHEGRVGAIREFGGLNSAEISQQLSDSHQAVLNMLDAMTKGDLAIKGKHPTWGEHTINEFVERYLIGHEQAHVRQVEQNIS